MTYTELQNKYTAFVYKSYEKIIEEGQLTLVFHYELVGNQSVSFVHKVKYNYSKLNLKAVKEGRLDSLIFHIGLVETINYWKLACPKLLKVECGQLNESQVKWWRKLFYHGLGEFIYLNRMVEVVNEDNFVQIESCVNGQTVQVDPTNLIKNKADIIPLETTGNLIPIGGGKDSAVTLEVLRDWKKDSLPFVMSAPKAAYDCFEVAGYEDYLEATRIFDQTMMDMNSQGFLNGHVPFSAILAFIATLGAALTGKRYIPLSNERSANEPSVIGTTFNHQYSKSFEFEQDFSDYLSQNLTQDIHYYSLLRPLYEIEIGQLFSLYTQYHPIYRSCNRGKKTNSWCGKCSKCLFVYTILSPYLSEEALKDQFGKSLFEDMEMLDIFKELVGVAETKPFECVGTIWEVRYALNKRIKQLGSKPLPDLLAFYKANGYDRLDSSITDYEAEGDLVPHVQRQALEREMKKLVEPIR